MRLVKKLKSETGITVLSLPVVFTMFTVLVCVAWLTQDVGSADIVLKNSVAIATQAASQQFDAHGWINYSEAQAAFTLLLDQNCQLDNSLLATSHSPFLGQADYVLIVYNGSTRNDDPSGAVFTYSKGVLFEKPVTQTGFPAHFILAEGVRVTLKSPGSVSKVRMKTQDIFWGRSVYTRWASSHLANINGHWIALLQGQTG